MYNIIRAMVASPATTVDDLVKALKPYDKKDELPMNHFFGTNLYVRQAMYPKGTVIVGRMHKFDHVFMLVSGKISVWTVEGRKILTGPCIFESKAGTQRIGYVHADAICLNMHGAADGVSLTKETAEEAFTVANMEEYLAINKVLPSVNVGSLPYRERAAESGSPGPSVAALLDAPQVGVRSSSAVKLGPP